MSGYSSSPRYTAAIGYSPIAVSPVIVGLMAVLLFGRNGWFFPWFSARGIQILFAVPSMAIVTLFICIPFVVREVAPLLQELGTGEEEAARTLGAPRVVAVFQPHGYGPARFLRPELRELLPRVLRPQLAARMAAIGRGEAGAGLGHGVAIVRERLRRAEEGAFGDRRISRGGETAPRG